MKKILKTIVIVSLSIVVLILLLFCSMYSASAYYVHGNYEFEINSDGDTATIVGYVGTATELEIPEYVSISRRPYRVTAIGGSAFYHNTKLQKVTMSDYITSIGPYAFLSNTNLREVVLSDSVVSIGYQAFAECSSLMEIPFKSTVTDLGHEAFHNTGWYNNQPDGLIYLGDFLYDYKINEECPETVYVKDGTKAIVGAAFFNCSNLKCIYLPNSLTQIGNYTFYNCSGLKRVYLPSSLAQIGEETFYGCNNLEDIIIPASVREIGLDVFEGCTELKQIGYMGNNKSNIKIDPNNKVLNSCCWLNNVCNYDSHDYSIGCVQVCKKCSWIGDYDKNHVFEENSEKCINCDFTMLPSTKLNISYSEALKSNDKFDENKILVTYENELLDNFFDYKREVKSENSKHIVTITGRGDYAGISVTKEIEVTIKDISFASLSVSDCEYTGNSREPSVGVSLGGKSLKRNTDYKVEYYNNVSTGVATAVVIGIGDYRGYKTVNFSITEPKRENASFKYGVNKEVTIVGGYLQLPDECKWYELYSSSGELIKSGSFPAPGAGGAKIYFSDSGEYRLELCIQGSSAQVQTVNGMYQYVYYYSGIAVNHFSKITYRELNLTTPKPVTNLELECTEIDYKTLFVNSNSYIQPNWKSSNTEIAEINDSGIVSLKKAGEFTITAELDGLSAELEYSIQPLNIKEKGSIIFADSESSGYYVVYDGCKLTKDVDYTESVVEKGNAKIITVSGKNLFDGELSELFYNDTGYPYCSSKITVSSLPEKVEYRRNKEELDLSGAKIDISLGNSKHTIDVEDWMVSGFDNSTRGKQNISVECYGAKTSFEIFIQGAISGDLTGDDSINSLDGLLLLRHLNGWNVNVEYPEAMDVNGDGIVNSLDGLLLLRYLNGWDVKFAD